jgi:hypothetical protein
VLLVVIVFSFPFFCAVFLLFSASVFELRVFPTFLWIKSKVLAICQILTVTGCCTSVQTPELHLHFAGTPARNEAGTILPGKRRLVIAALLFTVTRFSSNWQLMDALVSFPFSIGYSLSPASELLLASLARAIAFAAHRVEVWLVLFLFAVPLLLFYVWLIVRYFLGDWSNTCRPKAKFSMLLKRGVYYYLVNTFLPMFAMTLMAGL